jgi:hypothetical protein
VFTRRVVLGAMLLLFGLGSHSQQQIKSVLLPASAAATVHKIRGGEGFAMIGWVPAKEDIDSLETDLSEVAGLNAEGWSASIRIEHPEQYFRQYVGVVRSGQKLIYVNAFCETQLPLDWRDRLYVVDDGATCFWQALYDPSTRTFTHLTINARA